MMRRMLLGVETTILINWTNKCHIMPAGQPTQVGARVALQNRLGVETTILINWTNK